MVTRLHGNRAAPVSITVTDSTKKTFCSPVEFAWCIRNWPCPEQNHCMNQQHTSWPRLQGVVYGHSAASMRDFRGVLYYNVGGSEMTSCTVLLVLSACKSWSQSSLKHWYVLLPVGVQNLWLLSGCFEADSSTRPHDCKFFCFPYLSCHSVLRELLLSTDCCSSTSAGGLPNADQLKGMWSGGGLRATEMLLVMAAGNCHNLG